MAHPDVIRAALLEAFTSGWEAHQQIEYSSIHNDLEQAWEDFITFMGEVWQKQPERDPFLNG